MRINYSMLTDKDFTCPCCRERGRLRGTANSDAIYCVDCSYIISALDLYQHRTTGGFIEFLVASGEKYAKKYFWMLRLRHDIRVRRLENFWA